MLLLATVHSASDRAVSVSTSGSVIPSRGAISRRASVKVSPVGTKRCGADGTVMYHGWGDVNDWSQNTVCATPKGAVNDRYLVRALVAYVVKG